MTLDKHSQLIIKGLSSTAVQLLFGQEHKEHKESDNYQDLATTKVQKYQGLKSYTFYRLLVSIYVLIFFS